MNIFSSGETADPSVISYDDESYREASRYDDESTVITRDTDPGFGFFSAFQPVAEDDYSVDNTLRSGMTSAYSTVDGDDDQRPRDTGSAVYSRDGSDSDESESDSDSEASGSIVSDCLSAGTKDYDVETIYTENQVMQQRAPPPSRNRTEVSITSGDVEVEYHGDDESQSKFVKPGGEPALLMHLPEGAIENEENFPEKLPEDYNDNLGDEDLGNKKKKGKRGKNNFGLPKPIRLFQKMSPRRFKKEKRTNTQGANTMPLVMEEEELDEEVCDNSVQQSLDSSSTESDARTQHNPTIDDQGGVEIEVDNTFIDALEQKFSTPDRVYPAQEKHPGPDQANGADGADDSSESSDDGGSLINPPDIRNRKSWRKRLRGRRRAVFDDETSLNLMPRKPDIDDQISINSYTDNANHCQGPDWPDMSDMLEKAKQMNDDIASGRSKTLVSATERSLVSAFKGLLSLKERVRCADNDIVNSTIDDLRGMASGATNHSSDSKKGVVLFDPTFFVALLQDATAIECYTPPRNKGGRHKPDSPEETAIYETIPGIELLRTAFGEQQEQDQMYDAPDQEGSVFSVVGDEPMTYPEGEQKKSVKSSALRQFKTRFPALYKKVSSDAMKDVDVSKSKRRSKRKGASAREILDDFESNPIKIDRPTSQKTQQISPTNDSSNEGMHESAAVGRNRGQRKTWKHPDDQRDDKPEKDASSANPEMVEKGSFKNRRTFGKTLGRRLGSSFARGRDRDKEVAPGSFFSRRSVSKDRRSKSRETESVAASNPPGDDDDDVDENVRSADTILELLQQDEVAEQQPEKQLAHDIGNVAKTLEDFMDPVNSLLTATSVTITEVQPKVSSSHFADVQEESSLIDTDSPGRNLVSDDAYDTMESYHETPSPDKTFSSTTVLPSPDRASSRAEPSPSRSSTPKYSKSSPAHRSVSNPQRISEEFFADGRPKPARSFAC